MSPTSSSYPRLRCEGLRLSTRPNIDMPAKSIGTETLQNPLFLPPQDTLGNPHHILIQQCLFLKPVHSLMHQSRRHFTDIDPRHADNGQEGALQKRRRLAGTADHAGLGHARLNSAIGLFCEFEDARLSLTLCVGYARSANGSGKQKGDGESYPHQEVLAHDHGLLAGVPLGAAAAHVDESQWCRSLAVAGQPGKGFDALDSVIAADFDCLLPGHCC